MYTPPPSSQEMAALGVTPEDFANDYVDVWPDCWRSVEFFSALGAGDWAMGGAGPIGLRSEAFREVRLALGVSGPEWREVIFPDVRVMEKAALDKMAEIAALKAKHG